MPDPGNDVEILFDPFPKQMEFLEAVFSGKYTVIMYGGAIRGGKTFAGLGVLILLCKKYPKSRWAVVRKDLQVIKKNTLPSWNKIKPTNFIKSYNQDTQTVTFKNNSQIIFFGENYDDDKDLDRWRGLEVNGFLLEETEIQQATFYKAIERAGTHVIANKPKPLIICTCNPSRGFVKELFYDRHKNNTLPDKWLYIQSKIFDNPYVYEDTDFMDNLRFMPRYDYDVFVNGNWDIQKKTGAEFYKEFSLDHQVKKLRYNPQLPVWIVIDENVNPYFPCTIWQFDGNDSNCIREFALKNPKNTTRDLAFEVDSWLKGIGHEAGEIISGDATSQKEDVKQEKGVNLFVLIKNEFNKLGRLPSIRVQKSNPNVVTRQQFMNTLFYNQNRNEPYHGLRVFYDIDCKLTIEDMQNVKESPKDKGGKHKEESKDPDSGISSQKYGHMSDTSDYAICLARASEYELFLRGGKSFENISTGKRTSKNGW